MWIYKKNSANSARFVLGEKGKRPLVCFGINPSTATPEKLDRTLMQVKKIVKQSKEFDGWIMLNVYPQRATDPEGLDKELDDGLHKRNLSEIESIFSKYSNLTAWAAWGNLIEKRPFFKQCLKDILTKVSHSVKWVRMGSLTVRRHPRHPLYLKKGLAFDSFDVKEYLKNNFVLSRRGNLDFKKVKPLPAA